MTIDTFIWTNRATSVLAGSIGSGDTALSVSAGTGSLFPTPAAGQAFTITLVSASNDNTREIVYCTARSGDVLSGLIRGQEGTSPQSWSSGDLVKHLVTAGSLNSLQQTVNSRMKLNTDLSIFANFDTGNNSNDGLTSGTAVKDLQVAIAIATQNYDAGENAITIRLADTIASYAGATIAALIPGTASTNALVIEGNVVTPANTPITAVSGNAIDVSGGAQVTLTGVTLQASGAFPNGYGVLCQFGGSLVTIGPAVVFGACATSQMAALNDGQIIATSGYTIANVTSGEHWHVDTGGRIEVQAQTVTLIGTPAFTTFAAADTQGALIVPGNTFSGGSATGVRYTLDNLSLIFTNGAGATYLPGSVSGVAPANGAIYN